MRAQVYDDFSRGPGPRHRLRPVAVVNPDQHENGHGHGEADTQRKQPVEEPRHWCRRPPVRVNVNSFLPCQRGWGEKRPNLQLAPLSVYDAASSGRPAQ